MNLATLLPWSAARLVQTKRGPRYVQNAPPTPEFLREYRDKKSEFYALGISVGEKWKGKPGELDVVWWREVPPEEKLAKVAAIESSRATDCDIEIPCPAGLAYMGYQKAGIAFALKRMSNSINAGVLIADEQGLGKTVEAIGIINATPTIHRVLIICPASLKINWYRELTKWLTREMSIGIADSKCFPTTDIVIINFDIVHKFEKSTSNYWDILIIDEAHRMKDRTARRSKAIMGFKASKKDLAAGKVSTSGIPSKRKVAMTGTPIVNKTMELYTLISWLDPVRWNNVFSYAKRYANATKMTIGHERLPDGRWVEKKAWDMSGSSNLDELQRELRGSGLMLRRLKKDCLTDLPPKMYQVIELPSDGCEHLIKQEQDAFNLREEKLSELQAAVELSKASENPEVYKAAVDAMREGLKGVFSSMSKQRHDTGVAKLKASIEHIKVLLEDTVKIIIFAHHIDVIDGLMAAFSTDYKPVRLTGQMSLVDKQKSVDSFQQDPSIGPFIGNIQAAGVGITLTASSTVVFVEEDWTPAAMAQASDRPHRLGQKSAVLVQFLVLNGSLDSSMCKMLVEKQAIIDKAMDGVKAEAENEAVVPSKKRSIGVTREQLERESHNITPEQVRAVHAALRTIAGVCNGAVTWDGMGFSKVDARIGKDLAMLGFLTPKQATLGRKIVSKYRRQVPERLLLDCGIKLGEKEI